MNSIHYGGRYSNGPYDAEDFRLVVLNRWGNLIWESWNAEGRWDGTYSMAFPCTMEYILGLLTLEC
jgi:hypothetical protein